MPVRIIYNKQQVQTQLISYNGTQISFDREAGYLFSDHENFKPVIEYFKGLKHFEVVGDKKVSEIKPQPVEEEEEEAPVKKLFSKSKNKKSK